MLNLPIEKLYRVGPAYKKKLKNLGVENLNDLFFHFPHRYENFADIIKISDIKIGQVCTVIGEIVEIKNIRTWKKRMNITEALVKDDSGAIKIIWFNQPYLTNVLKEKDRVFISGKVASGKNGIHITNPVYEKADKEDMTHTGRIIPVYPETEGLSSRWLRSIIKPFLYKIKDQIPETLPEQILKENNFLSIGEALRQVHFPDSEILAKRAKQRFAFEELFLIQVFVLRERAKLSQEKSISIPSNIEATKEFVDSLSFKLTDAQKKCAWRILKDLEKTRPMNRLLEGDVGSGKTVVAAIAALNTIKAGFQVAFMAPTEILAKQHFQEIFKLFNPAPGNSKIAQPGSRINIGLLTGKEDKFYSRKLKNDFIEVSRNKLLEKTLGKNNPRTGKREVGIDILIGTHALIQDKVKFGKLALVILDEQHRFGVKQRARLCQNHKETKIIPHLLSMTATPIPRTLALTIYGDLDLSLIDELPKGRKQIITEVIKPKEREKYYKFVKKQINQGRQVFVICPRIEPKDTGFESEIQINKNFANASQIAEQEDKPMAKKTSSQKTKSKQKNEINNSFKIEVKAVKQEYEKLSKEIFPDLKIEMLHGKMKPKEKEKIMKDFKNKKFDILVSTSVIEVGIDVPNASVMIVEGAERFGLAQLHQFRGRVGRSNFQSYCFLFTDSNSKKTYQRLKALIVCKDGFKLAEKDLELRGPGDFTGIRQWGIPDLVMSSFKDVRLIEQTRQAARDFLQQDPFLKQNPVLSQKLKKFREKIHLE